MKNILKDERGAVGYLLIIEFLLSIFVTVIVFMLIQDVVGLFNVNFYTGTPFDIQNSDQKWTSDVLNGIFSYVIVFAVVFIGIKTFLESIIVRQ
jgi:hypothetical protein